VDFLTDVPKVAGGALDDERDDTGLHLTLPIQKPVLGLRRDMAQGVREDEAPKSLMP